MPLPDHFHELAAKVRNWGRWGDDDEIGTLNLIDADARRRGAAAVKSGQPFPLALPLHADGIQMGFVAGRINPVRTMISLNHPLGPDPDGVRASDDMVTMGLQAATHWDALAHVSYGGHIYNGFPAASITVEDGASKCGIDKVGALVTRGVLLDLPRALGVDEVAADHAVTGEDLDACAELAKVAVQPGDVVLLRTGQARHLLKRRPDKLAYTYPSPGPSVRSVEWFRRHDVAAVATDTMVFEVYPYEDPEADLPVHLLHLVEMGMTQGQNFVLEDLAVACAEDGRYDFLLAATPEPFKGGLGAPVAPVALR